MVKMDLILQTTIQIDYVLPKGKDKIVIRLIKDKLRGKIMTKLVGFRAKTCSYLIDDGGKDKKVKGTLKCVIKEILNLKKKLI